MRLLKVSGEMLPAFGEVPRSRGYMATDEGEILNRKGKVLKQWRERGILRVWIRGKNRSVHRLVAAGFYGEPLDDGYYVTWRDGDRTNNRPDNLIYAGRPVKNMRCLCSHGPEIKSHPEGKCIEPGCPCTSWRELWRQRRKLKT